MPQNRLANQNVFVCTKTFAITWISISLICFFLFRVFFLYSINITPQMQQCILTKSVTASSSMIHPGFAVDCWLTMLNTSPTYFWSKVDTNEAARIPNSNNKVSQCCCGEVQWETSIRFVYLKLHQWCWRDSVEYKVGMVANLLISQDWRARWGVSWLQ